MVLGRSHLSFWCDLVENANVRCWNCLSENSPKARRCESCDQPLKPNPAQTLASKRNVTYLLHEIESWSFLEQTDRGKVEAVYNARLSRLKDLGSSKTWVEWPVSDWAEVSPEPVEAGSSPEPADAVTAASAVLSEKTLQPAVTEEVESEVLQPDESEELGSRGGRPPQLLHHRAYGSVHGGSHDEGNSPPGVTP